MKISNPTIQSATFETTDAGVEEVRADVAADITFDDGTSVNVTLPVTFAFDGEQISAQPTAFHYAEDPEGIGWHTRSRLFDEVNWQAAFNEYQKGDNEMDTYVDDIENRAYQIDKSTITTFANLTYVVETEDGGAKAGKLAVKAVAAVDYDEDLPYIDPAQTAIALGDVTDLDADALQQIRDELAVFGDDMIADAVAYHAEIEIICRTSPITARVIFTAFGFQFETEVSIDPEDRSGVRINRVYRRDEGGDEILSPGDIPLGDREIVWAKIAQMVKNRAKVALDRVA